MILTARPCSPTPAIPRPTSSRARNASLLATIVALVLVGGPANAAPAPPLPKEETALPEGRPGETERPGSTFGPLAIPEKVIRFRDPSIAALAARIADGTGDLRDRRSWHRLSLLYAPFDDLPPAAWRTRALATGESISIAARRLASAADPSAAATYTWSSLGPTNFNVGGSDRAQGRASALWVHPSNTSFILAGFADGGVWKTTNAGTTWTPIADFEATTSVGSIDVLIRNDATGLTDAIVYVGLGEGNTAGSSVDGAGVLKSENGGAAWALQEVPWAGPDEATNARFRHSIRRIVIDRNVAGAQSVWMAADGGVYRTIDGGANWILVTALPYTGKPGVGGCWPELATDFVIDTGVSPSRLYVAFGARSNASGFSALSCTGVPNDVDFRKNNGIYRSTDGGTTWGTITGSGTGFPAIPGRVGRITLLQAPSDKKQMYALVSCVNNGAQTCSGGQYASLGIFRTSDATAATVAWTAGSTTNFCANQGWYDLTGAVDPTNPAKLLVGGLDAWLSTDGGATLTRKSDWTGSGTAYLHADQHHMIYASASTIFVASDGGIFRGSIAGTTISWSNLNSGGLSTLQFYGLAQHPTTANRIHGGLQDNGEAYTATGASWSMTRGGDGGFSATDWTNGEIAYEEYVYGAIARSASGGAGGWTCIQNFGGCGGCGGCVPDGQTAFIAPMTLDANDPAKLYTASKYVYRNASAPTASSWTRMSPDLVGTAYDHVLYVHSAPNGGVPGVLWATTLNGKVWITVDDGANWNDATQPPLPDNPVLPNRAAPWIATHPSDGKRAIVVFSGWNGSGSQPGHVFRTLDGGATWTDVSGALPDEPVFTVAVDPSRPNSVYIGTEFGVYVNDAGWNGSTWTKINDGQLPSVHVSQLEFSRANGKLRAATHGRGIWELTVGCPALAAPVLAQPTTDACGVQLSWTPAGSTYNVYRSTGGCPGGNFAPIATGVSGTTFTDATASGGVTYAYKVTAAESSGSCESAASPCESIEQPGACPCVEPPAFAGVASVSALHLPACSLALSWSGAAAVCGAAGARYNVYRSTDPGFLPAPENRIATCVTGPEFADSDGIDPGATYYYVVRAEDDSGVGSGPCRGGNEDGNILRRSGSAEGALVAADLDDGAEEAPKVIVGAPLWSQSAGRARSGSKSYFADGGPTSTCAALATPTLLLGPAGAPSVLTFWSWRDNLESSYDGGVVEISTDGGAGWTKLAPSPGYPATFASDSSSCAATTQAPVRAGFTGNDAAWQGPYAVDLSAYAGQTAKIRFDFGTDPAVTSVGWYLDDIKVTNVSQAIVCQSSPDAVAEVSSAASGLPLLVTLVGGDLVLSFEDLPGAGGYNVYEGVLGAWYSHAASPPSLCGAATSPAGLRRETVVAPGAGGRYYLVTAHRSSEGPSGFATGGEVPPVDSVCPP